MTPWSRDGLRASPPETDDFHGFSTLKKSLSAMSTGKSRSRSPKGFKPTFLNHKRDVDADPKDIPKPVKDPQLFVDIPKIPRAAEAALSALQYLPTPLLVLSSLKTVILANDAMGRLLGLDGQGTDEENADEKGREGPRSLDLLRGQSLSQIGIDVIEDGQSIWVSWEVSVDSKLGRILLMS